MKARRRDRNDEVAPQRMRGLFLKRDVALGDENKGSAADWAGNSLQMSPATAVLNAVAS
jgi:hypothetical protein